MAGKDEIRLEEEARKRLKNDLNFELIVPYTQEVEKIIKKQKIEYYTSEINNRCFTYDVEMLKHFLTTPFIFENLKKILSRKDSLGNFEVYLFSDDVKGQLLTMYAKSAFVKILQSSLQDGTTRKLKKKIEALVSLVEPSPLLNSDEVYSVSIGEGEQYNFSLPVKNIVKFFMEDYKNAMFSNFLGVDTCGLSKEQFLFVVYSYATKTRLLDNYVFDDLADKYFSELDKGKIIDFYAFKNVNQTKDTALSEVKLNPELVEYLFEGMPKDYSDLEKAVYLYIKMCRTFTYDPYFFASKEVGKSAKVHQDITRLEQLTPSNNMLVCYEFTRIYGKLLNMLNINYEARGSDIYGAPGHSYLRFKIDDIVISADSTKKILGGDLYEAKVHGPIMGLDAHKSIFQPLLDKVIYKVSQEIYKSDEANEEKISQFGYWKELYNKLCKENKNSHKLSVDEKFGILVEQMDRLNLPLIDSVTYMRRLCYNLFELEEIRGDFSFSFVKKAVKHPESDYELLVVMSFKDKKKPDNKTRYVIYDNEGSFNESTLKDIQKRFKSGEYKYINKDYEIIGLEP